jgi:hypothetical protein
MGLGLTSNQRCTNCGYLPTAEVDPTLNFLKRCSGCRMVFYCNRECQTKGWKSHKAHCKLFSERTAERLQAISADLGSAQGALWERFDKYAFKWHDKHIRLLIGLAHMIMTEDLAPTCILVINCCYSPARLQHQQMYIETYGAPPREVVHRSYPNADFDHPIAHRDDERFVYYNVLIQTTNLDLPFVKPHSIVSSLSRGKKHIQEHNSIEAILADFNEGCFMLL